MSGYWPLSTDSQGAFQSRISKTALPMAPLNFFSFRGLPAVLCAPTGGGFRRSLRNSVLTMSSVHLRLERQDNVGFDHVLLGDGLGIPASQAGIKWCLRY